MRALRIEICPVFRVPLHTMTIWFASGNAHKKAELSAVLNAPVLIPVDAGIDFNPEENGTSFHENAFIKAQALCRLLNGRRPPQYREGDPVIADDSGLCVDALGGRPGIFSARYAGAGGAAGEKKLSDSERNALLLAELGDAEKRSARFVCAMALLINPNRFYLAQETLEGEIVKGPQFAKGSGGFGYDPILYIPEFDRTVAELSEDEKNRVSHRGKAGRLIARMLRAIYTS
jgi:XTP/dITP diphosphohydrolase